MNLATSLRRWIHQVAWACSKPRHRGEEPLVFAVTRCYPTRLALYAAAFQGGWRVSFMKTVREAAEATHEHRPKAVFYDQGAGDPAWRCYCSSLSRAGVPFVFLTPKCSDEDFLAVLAAGGYQVSGDPITSEEIVKAVDFAGEVASPVRVPVSG